MERRILALHVKFHQLILGEEAQDLVEYGLLAAMIAIGCIAALQPVTNAVVHLFNNINTTLSAVF